MRLGAHVALEAAVGAAIIVGAAIGALHVVDAARDYVASLEPVAHAGTSPVGIVSPIATAHLALAPAPSEPELDAGSPDTSTTPTISTAYPRSDDDLLAPLRTSPVTRVKINSGGTSLSLRIDFASGGRAAFKPQQIHYQSDPRREIAAYRIDRMLGIGRVPPAFARSFSVSELRARMVGGSGRSDPARFDAEIRARGGRIAGAVSWWIPEIDNTKLEGDLVDKPDAVAKWQAYLEAGATIPPAARVVVEQVSTMTLFDYMIDNVDRWSGNNIKRKPGTEQIYFMDNTMSFTTDPLGHRKGQRYLYRVETFSRRLVERLRAMSEAELRATLAVDGGPFDYLLSEKQVRAIVGRRKFALDYIDKLIAKHGEDAVLAFP